MIEPEIAFADLAADADLAEAFLKSIYTALLTERADDLAFFEKHVDKECRHAPDRARRVDLRAHGLRRRDQGAQRPAARSSSSRCRGAWTCRPSTSGSSPRRSSRARWRS
jgi:hypothetical protein